MILTSRERWHSLCQRLEAFFASERLINSTYDDLIKAYTEEGRHYHNLDHINDGLDKLDEVRDLGLTSDPDGIEVAWWFHDAVYDTTSHVNEEASAAVANNILKSLGFSDKLLAHIGLRMQVVELILATKHDLLPGTEDGRLIVDIDLASLGTSQEIFDQNTANIRKEYAHVSDEDFIRGIAQFFRKFLEGRPSIYLTEHFRKIYETQAQENLKRVIAKAV